MKTIGILGGMSWESTAHYYQYIQTSVRERLGGFHSAPIVMGSVDFARIESYQSAGNWAGAGKDLADWAQRIAAAGADVLILATNTMHIVAPAIESAIPIPLLHIADATGQRIAAEQAKPRVGLLGTRFTMEQDFYMRRLVDHHGIEVLIPEEQDRHTIHRIIFEELVLGKVLPESRAAYLRITEDLIARGAGGVILGCTEIGMLLSQEDVALPLYDTTRIHAEAAVDAALAV